MEKKVVACFKVLSQQLRIWTKETGNRWSW